MTVPAAVLLPDANSAETASQTLLSKAFGFDSKNCSPMIIDGDMMSYRYVPNPTEPNDFYVVDFKADYEYPMSLYHFCHPNLEENVHIEKDEICKAQNLLIVSCSAARGVKTDMDSCLTAE